MYKALTIVILAVTWIILSGQFDAFHLALGVVSILIVVGFSDDLLFSNRSQNLSERLRQLRLLPGYVIWLTYEIVLANLHVIHLAFHPAGHGRMNPRIVHFKTRLRTDFGKWLLANSITLTPGTVTIKIEGSKVYVHAISDQAALGLEGEMEKRIAHIFEPDQEADR